MANDNNQDKHKPITQSSKQRLSAIEIFLIAATVFVVGFVGWAVYSAVTDVEEMPEDQTIEETVPEDDADERDSATVPEAPEIESAEDLDDALDALDDTDLESGSDSEEELEGVEDEL